MCMPGLQPYAILLIMHGVMSLLHTQMQDVLTITDYEACTYVRTQFVLTPPWTASHMASKFKVDHFCFSTIC